MTLVMLPLLLIIQRAQKIYTKIESKNSFEIRQRTM